MARWGSAAAQRPGLPTTPFWRHCDRGHAGGAAGAQPAARSGTTGPTTTPPSAAEINAQGPKGTAPAKAQTGDAGKALAKTTAVVDKQQEASQEKANQTSRIEPEELRQM